MNMNYRTLTSLGFSNYTIKEDGTIINLNTSKTRAHTITTRYPLITLSLRGKSKTFSIHRLLAIMFIPNPENLPCVKHKDDDKYNYALSNLAWCTHSENNKEAYDTGVKSYHNKPMLKGSAHGQSKLTEAEVVQMRIKYAKGCVFHKDLAIEFGVGRRTVGDIINRKVWKHVQDKKPLKRLMN